MRSEVTIDFGRGRVRVLRASESSADTDAARAAAREWLDTMYEQLECEPLRASGKVLLIDRILAIAMAIGYDGLGEGAPLAGALATHATAALGRGSFTLDIPGLTVR